MTLDILLITLLIIVILRNIHDRNNKIKYMSLLRAYNNMISSTIHRPDFD